MGNLKGNARVPGFLTNRELKLAQSRGLKRGVASTRRDGVLRKLDKDLELVGCDQLMQGQV